MIPRLVPRTEVPDCARCDTDDRNTVRGFERDGRVVWLCATCAIAAGYWPHEITLSPALPAPR